MRKLLYIDCGMGAAGDMLTAALLELTPEPEKFAAKLNALGIPGVEYRAIPCVKCGIKGTRMEVLVRGEEECCGDHRAHEHGHGEAHAHSHEHAHEEHHHHAGMAEIEAIFAALDMPAEAKADALAVYKIIAEAESAVHGLPVSEVHFHEVGALDAVADVAAVSLLMRELAPARVTASPVHVGSGTVRCAHGILPVPAPATARILEGVPIYGGEVRGELCTPTGAALLKYFVSDFGPLPLMRLEKTGCGMGTKDFEGRANCLRAMLGEAE